MARRKPQPKVAKRRTKHRCASTTTNTTTTTAIKTEGRIHDPSTTTTSSPFSQQQLTQSCTARNYVPSSPLFQCQISATQQKTMKICRRRRRRHSRRTNENANCPSLLIVPSTATATTALPLAAYQPASLFMMLLVASVLPKNTFSLRWLALSGVGIGVGGGNHRHHRPAAAVVKLRDRVVDGECWWVNRFGRRCRVSFTWLVMLLHGGDQAASVDVNDDCDVWNRRVILLSLWEDVAATTLEKTFAEDGIRGRTRGAYIDEDVEEWSMDSILSKIPRGGGGDGFDTGGIDDQGKMYPGLVNMGNTCYLNAQLQCAYHVPYLRKLVLDAEDEVIREEVEVEGEVYDDEQADIAHENHHPPIDKHINDDGNMSTLENISELPSDEIMYNYADNPILPKSKAIKEKIVPISHALRALKVSFNSLHDNNPSSSSGSTSILCRTLGINPYLQQDGQEFWKLFIPEIDYSKLARLYSGYYEDYVREIVTESEATIVDAEFVASDDYGEEKKDDMDFEYMSIARKGKNDKARERKRIEPFLDISIPVTEGSGGSVEGTLREMFTQPEILRVSEGNGWRYSKGDEKVDAYKGATLKRDGLPSLLQLHLKRFKYDYETEETSKINGRCSFPLELDLSDIIESDRDGELMRKDDAVYDLQSIVVHKGEYGSGHYYSYVRPEIRTNHWYRFDDEIVTRVDWADVVADAYGGNGSLQQKKSRNANLGPTQAPNSRQRFFFWPILALIRLFRRATLIGSNTTADFEHQFGYGGENSNAYMLQYVRQVDIPILYLEESDK